jgi:hypothetical protein
MNGLSIQIDPSERMSVEQRSPERDLVAGVLHQAILDWRRWPSEIKKLEAKLVEEKDTAERHHLRQRLDRKQRSLGAVQSYLFESEDETYIFSFRGICMVLDLDPHQVRTALKNGDGINEKPKTTG